MTRVLGIDTSLTGTGLARIDVSPAEHIPGVTDDMTGVTFSIATATVSAPKPTADKSKRAMAWRVNVLISSIEHGITEGRRELRLCDLPDLIVIESLAYGAKGSSAWVLPWVFGRVIELAEKYDIPLLEVSPGQRAKYISGVGNAHKDTVLAAAIKRWPEADIRNNNEADAVGLAAVGCHHLGLPIVTPAKYHDEVMAAIRKSESKLKGGADA